MSEEEDERYETAALWWEKLHSDDHVDSEAFEAWLHQDPRNQKIFDNFRAGLEALNAHAASPELLAARSAALADVQRQAALRARGPKRIDRRVFVGMAASLLAVPVAGLVLYSPAKAQAFHTGTGEQRAVTLEDKSSIFLDANTSVKVRYSRDRRHIELINGRAKFTVAKNPARPFEVVAKGAHVVALGTEFNVEARGADLSVTLLEGSVRINNAQGPEVVLQPGQSYSVAADQPPLVRSGLDTQRETEWQQGRLFFSNERLASVAARMNDYSATKIVIGDDEAANLRVTGTFLAGKSGTFADAMKAYFPVTATQSGVTITISSAAKKNLANL